MGSILWWTVNERNSQGNILDQALTSINFSVARWNHPYERYKYGRVFNSDWVNFERFDICEQDVFEF